MTRYPGKHENRGGGRVLVTFLGVLGLLIFGGLLWTEARNGQ